MATATAPRPLGLVSTLFHVGFAGSRELCDPTVHSEATRAAVTEALARHLAELLAGLGGRSGLVDHAVPCGATQVAVGADAAFAEALAARGRTVRETRRFLIVHNEVAARAGSEEEPVALMAGIEPRLLGEVVGWSWRRIVTDVS